MSKPNSKLRISFGSHADDPFLENIKISIEELSESLSSVETELKEYPNEYKERGYFVRGRAEFAKKYTTGKGEKLKDIYPRNDGYIEHAEILVADIDETKYSPKQIHKKLKNLKLQHIIYTSFSHTPDKPRVRIVLPCVLPSKSHCKPTTEKLEKELGIKFDECSYRWCQRWYYGYAKYPEHFKHYPYLEGEKYSAVSAPQQTNTRKKKADKENRKANRKSIGKEEHFYDQTLKLAQGYANNNKTAILGDSTDNDEVFENILDLLKRDAKKNDCDLDSYKHIENVHAHIRTAIQNVISENPKKKKTNIGKANNIFEVFEDMTVTNEMVEHIESIKPLYKDVIAKGHIVGFIGLPNSGKTTLMRFFVEKLTKKYSVVYVNMDIGPDEIKYQQKHANKFKYKLISPNFTNSSNQKVLEKIEAIGDSGMDLSNAVMIVDSTKKLVKVNQKDIAADFLEVLRKANSKGMTIILLMHTTKYRDADGNLIHAGTQDFIDDIDETNFIESVLVDDIQRIAIYPDKMRNTFVKKTSYTYKRSSRIMTRDKVFNDLKKVNVAGKKVRKNDNDHILSIIDAIQNGTIVKGKIVSLVSANDSSHSAKHTRELLDALSNESYTGHCLIEEKEGCANNATEYTLKDDFDLKVYKKLLSLKIK